MEVSLSRQAIRTNYQRELMRKEDMQMGDAMEERSEAARVADSSHRKLEVSKVGTNAPYPGCRVGRCHIGSRYPVLGAASSGLTPALDHPCLLGPHILERSSTRSKHSREIIQWERDR